MRFCDRVLVFEDWRTPKMGSERSLYNVGKQHLAWDIRTRFKKCVLRKVFEECIFQKWDTVALRMLEIVLWLGF